MPIPLIPIAAVMLAGAALTTSGGYLVDKTGEATADAANSIVKIAAAAVVSYVILKKTKVI